MDFINTKSVLHRCNNQRCSLFLKSCCQPPSTLPFLPAHDSHPIWDFALIYRVLFLDVKHHFQRVFSGRRSKLRQLWQLQQSWKVFRKKKRSNKSMYSKASHSPGFAVYGKEANLLSCMCAPIKKSFKVLFFPLCM